MSICSVPSLKPSFPFANQAMQCSADTFDIDLKTSHQHPPVLPNFTQVPIGAQSLKVSKANALNHPPILTMQQMSPRDSTTENEFDIDSTKHKPKEVQAPVDEAPASRPRDPHIFARSRGQSGGDGSTVAAPQGRDSTELLLPCRFVLLTSSDNRELSSAVAGKDGEQVMGVVSEESAGAPRIDRWSSILVALT